MTGARAAIALLLLVAGCSGLSREGRIEERLEAAGLRPKLARCLAPRLARDLDDDQLRALARATAPGGDGHGKAALRRRLAALDDPHVADVVSRAIIGCTILG